MPLFCPYCKKNIDDFPYPWKDRSFCNQLIKLADGTKGSEEISILLKQPRWVIYRTLVKLRKETGKSLPLAQIVHNKNKNPRGPNDHHKIFCEYQLGSTFKEIGDKRKLSSTRVRQIYERYLRNHRSLSQINNKHWEGEFSPKDENARDE